MFVYFGFKQCICGCSSRIIKVFIFPWAQLRNKTQLARKLSNNDNLDHFTNQLMQNKINQWQKRKAISQPSLKQKIFTDSKFDLGDLHSDELDRLFEKAINIGDHRNIIKLSTECIKYNKCPSLPILIQVLSICSENGDKQTITEIVGLCEKNQPEILDDNSYFQHYLAEAIWIKGNIIKSLRLFEQVYKENQFLRRRIRLMLQSLIADSILNHSEAALLNIKIFCEKLAKEYNDYHPLSCIWQSCMLSEWYTDQCLALDLLMENCGLRKALSNRINFAVNSLLNTHSTDIVYRLIEILLKCDMRSEAAGVLLAMFDYWIRNCNMTRCNEIVKWTIEQDIELPAAQQDKFVRLLLGEKIEVTKNKKRTYDKTPPNYRF